MSNGHAAAATRQRLQPRHQATRFVLAGGVCFVFEVSVFALVFRIVDSVALANAAAVASAAALNYTLHLTWVFRTLTRRRTTSTRYVLSLIVSYLLSTGLVSLLVAVHVPEVPAKMLVGLMLAPVAFLAGRHWVYPGS